MIDAQTTITTLTTTVDAAHVDFAFADLGLPGSITGQARERMVAGANVPPRPEIVDARALLATLKDAASKYMQKWATSSTVSDAWLTTYRTAFVLLDRHARYVLSLTTTAPSALAFAADLATHDSLVTRANTAAGSGAPSAALTDLARYRTAFDAAWTSNPASTVPPEADTSPEGVALTAALAAASECIAYLTWAQANPT